MSCISTPTPYPLGFLRRCGRRWKTVWLPSKLGPCLKSSSPREWTRWLLWKFSIFTEREVSEHIIWALTEIARGGTQVGFQYTHQAWAPKVRGPLNYLLEFLGEYGLVDEDANYTLQGFGIVTDAIFIESHDDSGSSIWFVQGQSQGH